MLICQKHSFISFNLGSKPRKFPLLLTNREPGCQKCYQYHTEQRPEPWQMFNPHLWAEGWKGNRES